MISNSPQVQGMTPWILKDFRAMLRSLGGVQDFRNRKGLIDENGRRKGIAETFTQVTGASVEIIVGDLPVHSGGIFTLTALIEISRMGPEPAPRV